jgi:fucose 4-O-acetylase-like acetyltransferase
MRLAWIDALKGFGIVLVVFAHYRLPEALDTYIFSFHMPLFFFISGCLFNFVKYTESATNFVKGRFKSLIIPYFAFAALTCLFYYSLDEIYSPGVTSIKFFEADILYRIYSILYAQTSMIAYNGPLWFLTCLFVTELLFYWLAKRYYWQSGKLVIWLTVAGIIGYLYSVYVPFRLFWNADIALTAIVFYGAGNLFRKLIDSEEGLRADSGLPKSGSRLNKVLYRAEHFLPGLFILVSLLYFVYLLKFPTSKINMSGMIYGGFFSFYFLAFSGIFAFIYIFKRVGSLKVLEYYGRNSLIVLALHFPMKDILTKLSAVIFDIDLDCFGCTTSFALILTVLNLLGLTPIIYIINKHFPFLAGKKSSSARFEGFKIRFRKSSD